MTEEKKLTGYPSIDKPWLKYYSEEAINAPLPDVQFTNIYGRTTKTILQIQLLSILAER